MTKEQKFYKALQDVYQKIYLERTPKDYQWAWFTLAARQQPSKKLKSYPCGEGGISPAEFLRKNPRPEMSVNGSQECRIQPRSFAEREGFEPPSR